MDSPTLDLVRRRAGDRCEYCLLRQDSELRHHVEHIVARQHGGSDNVDNLALACRRCNFHKGPNLAGLDPETGRVVRLFDPRRDRWSEHFAFARITGLTEAGRATIPVLDRNDARRLELRAVIMNRIA